MLDNEDEEIADWFTKEFSKKYEILFKTEVEACHMGVGYGPPRAGVHGGW